MKTFSMLPQVSTQTKGRVGVVNEPQSLRELVESAASRLQTPGCQLASLGQKEGFTLTTTTVSAIRQGTYKSVPTNETLRAIAWLPGVKDEVSFMSAGQPVPGPPFAEELPPGVDNHPAKARKAAIDMLRVLVDMNQEVVGNEGDHPTRMNQAGKVLLTPRQRRPSTWTLTHTQTRTNPATSRCLLTTSAWQPTHQETTAPKKQPVAAGAATKHKTQRGTNDGTDIYRD